MNAIRGWRKLLRSFGFALRGIESVFRTEQNFRIHLLAGLLVGLAGLFFGISPTEWLAVVLSIGLVTSMEVMNTALEYLADAVHPEKGEAVGRAKDAAAGAVMIAALAAVVVGAIVFFPKVWEWLSKILASSGSTG